ncbi:hypothetical protein ASE67_02695 [Sphingomonas sp. Leaf23]|uniref:hypothetical protein n=1 Tax=Sphingomonas sp. Leaf23 TaxID=1735689 RepID=UPI0006F444C6|nr:hypothetical protein [Sphingomonas sp. Leaf23]KQM88668.1 hypothetical protein ASE67_02695 [Sphingomonas sp. Leaf23]
MAWLAGFSALSVCGLLLAVYSRDEDARLLAVALVGLAGAGGALWTADAMTYLPLIDWLIAVLAFVMWDVRRADWLRAFVAVCVVRLGTHIGIAISPPASLWLFYHLLNATFVAQVFIVSKQGGIRAGNRLFFWLRGVRVAVPAQAFVGHG